jgi:homoserine kinase
MKCPELTQVAGILLGDAELTGRALDSDCIVEPVRGPLIPGFAAVKEAAKGAGVVAFISYGLRQS